MAAVKLRLVDQGRIQLDQIVIGDIRCWQRLRSRHPPESRLTVRSIFSRPSTSSLQCFKMRLMPSIISVG